ncbi:hypothetical protein PEPS_08560 [Persicobacter psychrovividus]|uniref:Uncharacterized protein n=1 Tax=Persicobacter psychrovividus TaxID=387638 RepID=A0ABN6L5X9_9BACT|nr:hypothetical protein PEPS_08560 [Persicobacter psychrovividus]
MLKQKQKTSTEAPFQACPMPKLKEKKLKKNSLKFPLKFNHLALHLSAAPFFFFHTV